MKPENQNNGELMSEKGYIHVYTGNGKGKTTAAFGLALRAAGAGMRVYIAQFVKGMAYSETAAFARFDDLITIEQFGRGCFIRNNPTQEDLAAARNGLEQTRMVIASCAWDVVILDEANIAVLFGLLAVEDLINLIDIKPPSVELIITGRHANQRVIERADLVTEMREVKHYYSQGVQARIGIES
ncbi:MAG: cob(I)yrinic acid a,c-diamide adenosyltransferase [Phycisphaerales bacterium]|jgi:cob(I)alamin adenosyltransferase